jgi:hypothetical protein
MRMSGNCWRRFVGWRKSALASDSFEPVAVPAASDGLLPSPRVSEVRHG